MIDMLFFVLLGTLFMSHTHAFGVVPTQVAHVNVDHDIWKPSGAVVFEEGVACARAYQDSCPQCLQETAAICTSDGGKSFSVEQTQYPFCGDRGVVVNATLLCPLDVKQVNSSVINVSVVTYEWVDSLVETLREDITLSFNYWVGEEIVDIMFKGNSLSYPEENLYLMNTIVIRGNSTADHVLFSSTGGFIWNVQSRIPLEVGDKTALSRNGQHQITVSAFTKNEHKTVSSFYKGTRWGGIKYLNTSLPPTSLSLGLGIVIESGLSNQSTSLVLGGFVEGGNLKRKRIYLIDLYKNKTEDNQLPVDFTTDCMEGASCLTSSYVALMSLKFGQITALFDFVSSESHRKIITALTMDVDDTEEREELIKEKKKAEDRARMMEEVQRKIRQEKEERKLREREEKRMKERERRLRFHETDVANMEIAKSRMMEDGEMIVVRDVFEDLVDIEKRTFFW